MAVLISQSAECLVAERESAVAGLLICLNEGADYDSRNFQWLKRKYERFFYVDRIALAPESRGLGLGEALYDSLIQRLPKTGAPLCCEVNSRPPNPGSLKFHQRLGFTQIGTEAYEDKAVVFLARALDNDV